MSLHPFVHWGQSETFITLRIELTDVKTPIVDISESNIKFEGYGCSGSRGEQCYSFQINLYDKIDSNTSTYKINDREVNINLKKQKHDKSQMWPRLTESSIKLPWLKADFDKMTYSEDESDHRVLSTMDDRFQVYDENADDKYEDIYKSISESRNEKPKGTINLRTHWLVFFNVIQFWAYFWVFNRLSLHYVFHQNLRNGYQMVRNPIKLCQALAIFETIHPIIGFTKGEWITPLVQFLGRNLILFGVINYNPNIQSSTLVSLLLLVWSFIELFRYPYYICRVLNKDIHFLTWLRYTLWIVLYPMGAFLEGLIIYHSIYYYHSSQHFSLLLPNKINFSFCFAWFLRVYLIILSVGLLQMMRYMWNQRQKVLKLSKTTKRKSSATKKTQ